MDNEKLLKKFTDWKFGLFFHFGIRTYYRNHKDWDRVDMDAAAFNPVALDCNQWIKVAKEAGAKYTVLTTRHHDGFCLWPTKYTSYNIKNTPFKDGKGDIVKEYVEAARKENLGVGLYYSLAQWNPKGISAPDFENEKEYDEFMKGQLRELLSSYGKIDYLWFDGCGAAGHNFDIEGIKKVIYSLQPDILLFAENNWEPTVHWIGNEDGYAPENKDNYGTECDCMLRDTWFWDDNPETVKSKEKLCEMYNATVGRGSNMLLNVGPDMNGLIDEYDIRALKEFKGCLR